MSEFKGTPGPWSYQKTGEHWNNPSLINIEINFGNEGECIADTVYLEHDAMLISAAPELLEALQMILSGKPSDYSNGVYKAEQAIAKALGK